MQPLHCTASNLPTRALCSAVLVAWRSRRSTIMRFLAPMMFLLLALVMQVALDASLAAEGRYRPTTSGIRQDISSIPDCNSDLYIHDRPCVTLIYTPSTNLVAQVHMGRVLGVACRPCFHLILPQAGQLLRWRRNDKQNQPRTAPPRPHMILYRDAYTPASFAASH